MILTCKTLLFDLDGVLVDSGEYVEGAWRRWAEANQLDPDYVIRVAHGRRTLETIRLVAPHLPAEEESARLAAHEALQTEGIYKIPGARELLSSISGPWGVVTSGPRPVATLRIRHTALPFPPVLVCADDVRAGKPEPEGYLTAASRLGVNPSDCIVVEDAPPGIEAARQAGMRVIAVLGTYPPAELEGATVIVKSVTSLNVTSLNGEMQITATPAAPSCG